MRAPGWLTATLVAGALGTAVVAHAHAEEPNPTPSILAPEAPASPPPAPPPVPVCSGEAALDAPVAGCGLRLGVGVTSFEWAREATPIDAVLAGVRLAFRGAAPTEAARPVDYVTVWEHDEATGAWRSWSARGTGPFATLRTFAPGARYTIEARAPLDLSLAPVRPSAFTGRRIVSFYGHPGVEQMGVLGTYATAEAAARGVEEVVAQYQALDTATGRATEVVGALHLIVSVAQADPGWDGSYLGRMTLAEIRPWVAAARAHRQLLFLDVQVGWADPLTEVRRLEPLLVEPHVHLALDPEFATKGKGWAPGESIGYLTPEQVNAVQRYLVGVAEQAGVPSKVLVLHQFRADMLQEPERIERLAGVDVVIDMDGWGPAWQKLQGYQAYALAPYAEYAGFKLFYRWDQPLMTPAEVMALAKPPDYVIYQ